LKLIANVGQSLCGRLLTFDAMAGGFKEFGIKRNQQCKDCS